MPIVRYDDWHQICFHCNPTSLCRLSQKRTKIKVPIATVKFTVVDKVLILTAHEVSAQHLYPETQDLCHAVAAHPYQWQLVPC